MLTMQKIVGVITHIKSRGTAAIPGKTKTEPGKQLYLSRNKNWNEFNCAKISE
jgi:hypothetical protein